MSDAARGSFERRVRRLTIVGVTVSVVALAVGLVLASIGAASAVATLLIGLCGLVVLPVLNVVAAFVEEVQRREWVFAGTALAVLGILAYNVYRVFG